MTKRKAVPRRQRGGAPSAVAPIVLTRRYIESSALVAALLEHDAAAIASIRASGERITSSLTVAEVSRALVRARSGGRISAQKERDALRSLEAFTRRSHLVSVTEAILARAGRPFAVEPIRTLDAIHMATVASLQDPLVVVVTRDSRVRENARALGYAVE
ncbi:MAG: type II toxin-antitoxin system VapC family toxin [Acidobacteria bacterium]|nr:type II toxin-antitoxin system VapC family toxin [Acidobacteriota bacterium]